MATAVNIVLWRVFGAAGKTRNEMIILTQAGKCLIYHDINLHIISVFYYFFTHYLDISNVLHVLRKISMFSY